MPRLPRDAETQANEALDDIAAAVGILTEIAAAANLTTEPDALTHLHRAARIAAALRERARGRYNDAYQAKQW